MSHSLSWSSHIGMTSATKSVPHDELANLDLIHRCMEGLQPNRVAFAELMRRYQPHVDRVLYKLAPDWQDRADLAQEVWLRVYRNIKRLQEPERFRSWLARITTNLFYDELRRRKRSGYTVSLDAPLRADDGGDIDWELPSDAPGPTEALSTQEFYEHLHAAIAELPEEFRITIVLREIEGMAYEEIAEITRVSLGTVKSRIARARMKLQSRLQPYLSTL